MKRIISVLLVLALLFGFAGCSLFSDSSIVKFDETYTHKDPEGLSYDDRIVLKGDGFEITIEDYVNQLAYPDTMVYDEEGNIIGIYDYDPATGLATGWMSTTDSTYVELAGDEVVDLGMPDESLLIDIPGTVTMGSVVYGKDDAAVCACLYLFLSDASAGESVISSMEMLYGLSFSTESDTVLTTQLDKDAIAQMFATEEEYGVVYDKEDAASLADILKMYYGLREYGGVNPYKPYEDHADPEGLDFDERVILTGAGEYAVTEECVADLSSITDYIYGKDGVVIAQYTYFQCASKDAADHMMECANDFISNPVRVSDTVIQGSLTGQELADLIVTYKGYSILSDDSLDGYVKMIEGSYFSAVYE